MKKKFIKATEDYCSREKHIAAPYMRRSFELDFSPEKAEYSAISLIIISVAIVVKLILGQYVKRQGKKHNSGALTASGSDALFDAILSASVRQLPPRMRRIFPRCGWI